MLCIPKARIVRFDVIGNSPYSTRSTPSGSGEKYHFSFSSVMPSSSAGFHLGELSLSTNTEKENVNDDSRVSLIQVEYATSNAKGYFYPKRKHVKIF